MFKLVQKIIIIFCLADIYVLHAKSAMARTTLRMTTDLMSKTLQVVKTYPKTSLVGALFMAHTAKINYQYHKYDRAIDQLIKERKKLNAKRLLYKTQRKKIMVDQASLPEVLESIVNKFQPLSAEEEEIVAKLKSNSAALSLARRKAAAVNQCTLKSYLNKRTTPEMIFYLLRASASIASTSTIPISCFHLTSLSFRILILTTFQSILFHDYTTFYLPTNPESNLPAIKVIGNQDNFKEAKHFALQHYPHPKQILKQYLIASSLGLYVAYSMLMYSWLKERDRIAARTA